MRMRLAKILLSGLICLGVAFQGFAGAALVEPPCPMTQAAPDTAMSPAMSGEQMHDCCTDAATFAKTGKMCKSGMACLSVSQAPRTFLGLIAHVATVDRVTPIPAPLIDTFDPSSVWRPPALI